MDSNGQATTGSSEPLMCTLCGSPSTVAWATRARRGLAEHDAAGRRHRFHPLRHAHLFTDRGVTRGAVEPISPAIT